MKTNKSILKAILRKLCKENNVDINNVFIHETYGYIVTLDFNKKDVDYLSTDYKGKNYKVQYVSGCFNPYIIEL